jgi:hypothetical protein
MKSQSYLEILTDLPSSAPRLQASRQGGLAARAFEFWRVQMSFVIRPLLAAAALALATPAFAQVGAPVAPTTTTATAPVTTAQTTAKTEVKAPDTKVKTDTAAKTGDKMKSDAKVTGTMEKKDKTSKVDTKAKTKVSANTHHHGKVTKKA